MSFILDPPALLLFGFLSGKAYYLLTIFGNRLFKRGALRKNLWIVGAIMVFIFWLYSSLLYLNIIYFPWPFAPWYGGTEWMLNSGLPLGLSRSHDTDLIAFVIFATYPLWFYFGTELGLAGHRVLRRQRLKERSRIIRELVAALFPEGGAIPPSAEDVDTSAQVDSLLKKIPPVYSDALTFLLFVFDSRFLVLAFAGRWKRFVDLDKDGSTAEKRKYFQTWESNPFLVGVTQSLRIAGSYGYYTRPEVYKLLDYSGPLIPDLPPWYNPGPC
ncbi:MAG: hypothetical protein ACREBS_10390 [Nitrososphaerales archaeon]